MSIPKLPSTCLFTGEILDSSTKIEHAIPNALGGRITSRKITSSRFNEATSDKFDKEFTDQYLPILVRLSPLLSRKFRDKAMILKSRDGQRKYRFKNAEIELAGIIVTKRDSDNKPCECLSALSTNCVDKVNKMFNWNPQSTMTMEVSRLPDILFFDRFEFTPEAHISALKSFLLAFDEMLTREEAFNFVRDDMLKPLRDFIRTVVTDFSKNYIVELDRYYWGLQLDNNNIIEKILKEYQYKRGSFEHILIVSSCSTHKMLYGVWDILGIETIGFCLCPVGQWHGPSFSAVISNPILRETPAPSIKIGPEIDDILCKRTPYKCFALNSDSPVTSEAQYYQTVYKIEAYHRAVFLVETTAEAHIIKELEYMALTIKDKFYLSDLMKQRLCGLFNDKSLESGIGEKIEAHVNSLPHKWDAIKAADFIHLSEENKHSFFEDYASVVKSIYDPLRPPGHVESGEVIVL